MRRVLLVCLGAALASACATSKNHLASVNGELIRGDDLQHEFGQRHASLEKYLAGDEKMIREFLESVIDRRLFRQEAVRVGLSEDPKVLAATRDFEGRKAAERLYEVEVTGKAAVTDEDVKAAYERRGVWFLAREIVVATRAEADATMTELKAGADFGAIARRSSLAPSAVYDGRFKPVQWGEADEASETALFALSDGGVSEPIELDGRWRILRLERRETAPAEGRPTLEQETPTIRAVLERRKLDAREREVFSELWKKYDVKLTGADASLEALQRAKAGEGDDVLVATWTGGSLGIRELARRIKLERLAQAPEDRRPQQTAAVVELGVQEEVMRAEALARNLQAEPELAKAVARQREKVMESRLFELYVYDGLAVTDEEIQAHYEQNLTRFTIPEKRKVMQVIVPDLEAANTMKARALAGEQFEELQKESRKTGGPELGGATGWLTKDKLHPGFEELFTAETGAIVGPVKSEVGFHVVKLVKIEPESRMPLAQLRETIRENVLFEKRADRTREWGDKLRREARIEISKAGIEQYVKDHPEVAIEVPSGPDMGMGGMGGHGMGGHGLRTGGGTVGAVAPHGAPGAAAPATP